LPHLTHLLQWSHQVTERQARQLAEDQISRIRERTRAGLDSNGQPFAPYTLEYSRTKGITVDLEVTGEMLESLRVIEANATGALIGVDGEPAVRAQAHQFGTGTMPQRHWLGTTEDEQNQMDATALRLAVLNYQGGNQ